MVTMEQKWLLGSSTPAMNIWGLLIVTIALPGNAIERLQRVGPEVIYRCERLRYVGTYACLFTCLYSFHKCFVGFVAYPNHMHVQIIVKTK
jgi:hypothetical protein